MLIMSYNSKSAISDTQVTSQISIIMYSQKPFSLMKGRILEVKDSGEDSAS